MREGGVGFVGGFGGGYNYQLGLLPERPLVVGLEADYQVSSLRGYSTEISEPDILHAGSSIDQLATLRLRGGYPIGRFLPYVTAGLAVGGVHLDTNMTELGFIDYAAGGRSFEARFGYVVGGGLEYAFANHLSAKIEGLYFDLGKGSIGSPQVNSANGAPTNLYRGAVIASNGFLIRAGLNYHLGGAPISLADLHAPALPAGSALPSLWSYEMGLRYFYSSGSFRLNLDAPGNASQFNSRLTYQGIGAHSGEVFARVENDHTGLFLKGFIGAGGVASGNLRDEDFPPVSFYSNTISSAENGTIAYANVDVGDDVLRREHFSLGGLLGYAYFAENINVYGCSQTAANQSICTNIPDNEKTLTEDAQWHAVRLGLVGRVNYDRFTITAEGAFLPFTYLDGYDHHWLRPVINPQPQTGHGQGYQGEASVRYAMTRNLSLGLGGRYWFMNANGDSTFPGQLPSPTTFNTRRFGSYLEAVYKFGE